jgi:penicillin-binding protein-related factor A (putative recombinase)
LKPRSEKEITASIRAYLKAHGIFHWKAWQGLGSQKGVSDIIGIYDGKFFAIEVKTEKGKLSKHQHMFLRAVIDAGGNGIIARSVDDVINKLALGQDSKVDDIVRSIGND